MGRVLYQAEIALLDNKELEIELEGIEEQIAEISHIFTVSNTRSLDKDLSNKYLNLNEKKRLINLKLNNIQNEYNRIKI